MNTNKVREHSSTSSSSRGRVKNLVNLFARIEKSESQPTTPPPGVDLRRSSRFRYSARFSNDDTPPLSRERDRRYSSCRRYGEERRRRTDEVASLDVVDHNNKESSSSESSPSAAAAAAAKMLNNIGTYRSYFTSLHQPQQSPSIPNASPSNHYTPHNQTQVRSSRFVSSTLSVVPKCNAQSPDDDDSGSNCKRRRSRKVTTSTTVEKNNNNNTDVVCVPSSAAESSSSSSGERSSHVQSLRNVVSSTSSIPECDLDTQVATSQDHTKNDACSDHVASSKPFFKRISNPCVTRKPSFRERSVDFKEVKEVFERRGNPFKCLKRTGSRIMNTLRPGRKGTHYDKVETKKVIRSTPSEDFEDVPQGETLAPVQSVDGDLFVDMNDECVQELENSLSNLESTISSLRERIADLENTIRNDLKVENIDLITEF